MTDRRTVQMVIGGLVVITLALLGVVSLVIVRDDPEAIPDAIFTLLGGAVGALSAMLARTSSGPDPTPPAAEPTDVPGTFPGKPPA